MNSGILIFACLCFFAITMAEPAPMTMEELAKLLNG